MVCPIKARCGRRRCRLSRNSHPCRSTRHHFHLIAHIPTSRALTPIIFISIISIINHLLRRRLLLLHLILLIIPNNRSTTHTMLSTSSRRIRQLYRNTPDLRRRRHRCITKAIRV
jgi:hypothetical protein